MTRLQDSFAALRAAMTEVGEAVHAATLALPDPPADVRALLLELADAHADSDEHFVRFLDETRKPWGDRSTPCRDDWRRCCERRDQAVAQLTRVALALRAHRPIVQAVDEMAVVADCDDEVASALGAAFAH